MQGVHLHGCVGEGCDQVWRDVDEGILGTIMSKMQYTTFCSKRTSKTEGICHLVSATQKT